jgi:hypothetical protein
MMKRPLWRWLAVFGAATVIDLIARFGVSFQLNRVLWVEAVLFPAAGFAFLLLMRRGPDQVGFRRKLQVFTIAAFFLAGLRSGLWAAGMPIGSVNLTVLAAAILVWSGFRIRRRYGAGANTDHS